MAFRYLNPIHQQYVSTFVPEPLEFLERQMANRQGRYDQGQSAVAMAQDAYGGADVNPEDIDEKNRIVNQYFGDIDEQVNKDFGGDYGKAFNLIKRRVAGINQNKFFQTAKTNREGLAKYNETKNRFIASGQKFHEYDPELPGQSSVDENGQLRTINYTDNIRAVEDVNTYLQNGIISKLTSQVGTIAARESDVDGLLTYGVIKGVAQDKIPGMVGQADVDALKQFSPVWVAKTGFNDEQIREYIINEAMTAVPYGVQQSYIRDPGFSASKTGGVVGVSGRVQLGGLETKSSNPLVGESTHKLVERGGHRTEAGNIIQKVVNEIQGGIADFAVDTGLAKEGVIERTAKLPGDKKRAEIMDLVKRWKDTTDGEDVLGRITNAEKATSLKMINYAGFSEDKEQLAIDGIVKSNFPNMMFVDLDTNTSYPQWNSFSSALTSEKLIDGKNKKVKLSEDEAEEFMKNAVPIGYADSELFPPRSFVMTSTVGSKTKQFVVISKPKDPSHFVQFDFLDGKIRSEKDSPWRQKGDLQYRGVIGLPEERFGDNYGLERFEVKLPSGRIKTFTGETAIEDFDNYLNK